MTDTPPPAEVLPCPFCGCKPTIKHLDTLFVFLCPETSPCFGSGMATYGQLDRMVEAIAAWNTRTILTRVTEAGEVERVARMIELALMRHGVAEEDCEGTLDDAEEIIAALRPSHQETIAVLEATAIYCAALQAPRSADDGRAE